MKNQKKQRSMWNLDMSMPKAAPMRMQGRAKNAFDPFDRPSLDFGGGGGLSGLFGAPQPMQRQVRQVQAPRRQYAQEVQYVPQQQYAGAGQQPIIIYAGGGGYRRKGKKKGKKPKDLTAMQVAKGAYPIVKEGIERATPYVRTATGKIVKVSREAAQIGAEKAVSITGQIRERYAEYKERKKAEKEAAQFEKRREEVGLYEAAQEAKEKKALREAERKGAEAWKKWEEK